jgi:cytochrome P450
MGNGPARTCPSHGSEQVLPGPVYDPFSFEIHEDPYPVYAWMREHAPVYRNEERDFWALSRYVDVLAALRDPQRFSNRNGISLEPGLWGPDAYKTSFFLAMDPPEHTRLRGLVRHAFSPREVPRLEGLIRELARARLLPLLSRPSFDFAGEFAAALPNDVICALIGIPATDRGQVRAYNDKLKLHQDKSHSTTAEQRLAGLRLAEYYIGLIADRRRHPGDDLISVLAQARVDGEPLTDMQLVSFLYLLVSGTNDSAGKLLGNAWYHGWLLPDVQRAGLNGRAADWMEETLRYDTPSQMTARTLTEDVEIQGTRIPAGSRVALLPASANRDRRVFRDPDRFDLDRDTSQSISFGHGPHFCLGANLARLEMRIALEEAATLVSGYEIDMAGAVRVHSPHQRGFAVLPCSVTLRDRPPPAV